MSGRQYSNYQIQKKTYELFNEHIHPLYTDIDFFLIALYCMSLSSPIVLMNLI